MSQFDWPMAKQNGTVEAPHNRRFHGKMESQRGPNLAIPKVISELS